jgi:hypothetical protein
MSQDDNKNICLQLPYSYFVVPRYLFINTNTAPIESMMQTRRIIDSYLQFSPDTLRTLVATPRTKILIIATVSFSTKKITKLLVYEITQYQK